MGQQAQHAPSGDQLPQGTRHEQDLSPQVRTEHQPPADHGVVDTPR